jgi:hypothetical protein
LVLLSLLGHFCLLMTWGASLQLLRAPTAALAAAICLPIVALSAVGSRPRFAAQHLLLVLLANDENAAVAEWGSFACSQLEARK